MLTATAHSPQRQFLAETKTEVKQQLLDMGIFSLGKVPHICHLCMPASLA
jgi:hypothetical protein